MHPAAPERGCPQRACFSFVLALALRTLTDLPHTQVVDFGCGVGAVLSMLALPAYHLDEWASPACSPSPPSPEAARTKVGKADLVASIPPPMPRHHGLHLERLVGVDADLAACEKAALVCAPSESKAGSHDLRWEELRTEVWHGGVEVYNEALEGVDAFVMTEVLLLCRSAARSSRSTDTARPLPGHRASEHERSGSLAEPPVLGSFEPSRPLSSADLTPLLAVYKPRVIIITTPNHCFNPYFPPPSSLASSRARPAWSRSAAASSSTAEDNPSHLFPDPTGRTRRVFRDATHTLEWTPDEFRAWCGDALESAGAAGEYEVEIGGVGSLEAYYRGCEGGVPFPPPARALHPALEGHPICAEPVEDPRRFFATQLAVFRRREGTSGAKGGDAVQGQEQQDRSQDGEQEDDERASRSLHVSPINTYSPLPPLDSTVPGTSSISASALPTTAAATTPSPRAPHALVAASTHAAHPSAALPTADGAVLREAVRGVFIAARRGQRMSLEEVWRMADRPSLTAGAGEGEREGEALRVLARGRVGAVLDALLRAGDDGEDEDEWVFARLREEAGRGRELRGFEALGVRWERYDEVVGELERREVEEAQRRWGSAQRDAGEDEQNDGASASSGKARPSEEHDAGDGAEVRREDEQGGAQQGSGAPSSELRGDEDSRAAHTSWHSEPPPTTTSGWTDDPW